MKERIMAETGQEGSRVPPTGGEDLSAQLQVDRGQLPSAPIESGSAGLSSEPNVLISPEDEEKSSNKLIVLVKPKEGPPFSQNNQNKERTFSLEDLRTKSFREQMDYIATLPEDVREAAISQLGLEMKGAVTTVLGEEKLLGFRQNWGIKQNGSKLMKIQRKDL
jgi:hypothetical protein